MIGTTAEELEAYAADLAHDVEGESPLDSLRRILAGMLAPASVDRELRARRRRVLLSEPALAPALVGNNIRIENDLTAALERRLGVGSGASLECRLTVSVAIAAVRACIEHQQNGGAGALERNIEQAFERSPPAWADRRRRRQAVRGCTSPVAGGRTADAGQLAVGRAASAPGREDRPPPTTQRP